MGRRPSGPRLTCSLCGRPRAQKRQNRFCKIEPSLATDSSEASEDGREASDGRSDVGRLERHGSPLRCACAWSRARAVGQPQEVVRDPKDCKTQNTMGAGASASEQSQLLAEARAGGATQEEIDAYIAENNLNTAQRPAQTQAEPRAADADGF